MLSIIVGETVGLEIRPKNAPKQFATFNDLPNHPAT